MSRPKVHGKSALVMVAAFIPGVIGLTLPAFSAIFPDLARFYGPSLGLGAVCFLVYLVSAAIALKDTGRSPWFALTGLLVGPVPLILYVVLPRESTKS